MLRTTGRAARYRLDGGHRGSSAARNGDVDGDGDFDSHAYLIRRQIAGGTKPIDGYLVKAEVA